jgi:hypothetical protein
MQGAAAAAGRQPSALNQHSSCRQHDDQLAANDCGIGKNFRHSRNSSSNTGKSIASRSLRPAKLPIDVV